MSDNIRKATPCEQAEVIIVDAMEQARKEYGEYITTLKSEESRLTLIDDYARTLKMLSKALRNISTECLSE